MYSVATGLFAAEAVTAVEAIAVIRPVLILIERLRQAAIVAHGGERLLNRFYPFGLHRMADLAPDNWNPASVDATVLVENEEEIGYRTPGWPAGLQELALLVRLPDGAMGELSMARPAVDGGFCDDHLNRLRPFLPLFECAFQQLWERQDHGGAPKPEPTRLEAFGRDVLSTREAEVMQLILKGHSSLSISLTLGIAVPTVKTHRRNAYAKLGVSTQQQLFNAFLTWRAEDSSAKT